MFGRSEDIEDLALSALVADMVAFDNDDSTGLGAAMRLRRFHAASFREEGSLSEMSAHRGKP
jgi:hypothetical protein